MPYTTAGIYYPDSDTDMSIADITQEMAQTISDNLGIVQVIEASQNVTATSTSVSSFTASGLTATITPRSLTSKIIVLVNMPFASSVTTGVASGWSGADFKLIRNTTDISSATALISGIRPAVSTNPVILSESLAINYVDSPASTSALTYSVSGKVYNGSPTSTARTLSMNYAGTAAAKSTIILMELAQ